MDSCRSAKEPSSAVADQVLSFSVKTPSPEANKDKSTLGQFNDLKISAPGDNNAYDYHGNNVASPKEDEAAFLPPDSPTRARSNSSELAITSKLLAETDALMNDTQALTSSKSVLHLNLTRLWIFSNAKPWLEDHWATAIA